MPDTTSISEAKEWCNDIRKLLGLAELSSEDKAEKKLDARHDKNLVLDQPAVSEMADEGAASQSFVVFTQSRLAWDRTRKTVQSELKKLEKAILEVCRDRPYFNEVAGQTHRLFNMLDLLDEALIDKLDEALNAQDPDRRQGLQREAGRIVDDYLAYVNNDPLVREIDDNPFTKVAVRSVLLDTLSDLRQKLAA